MIQMISDYRKDSWLHEYRRPLVDIYGDQINLWYPNTPGTELGQF